MALNPLTQLVRLTRVDSNGNVSVTANIVGSASKIAAPFTLSVTGDASGTVSIDGSSNSTLAVSFANSGATAGSYGSSTSIPVLTVDAKGRITNITTSAITAGTPLATANTTVQRDDNASFAANVITATLVGTASNATTLQTSRNIALSGDALGSASFNGSADANISLTLSNSGVTSGTYGNTTAIPVVTVDAKGRITDISTSTISAGTPLATPSTTVQRDANASFAANIVTANLVGNVTGNADTATKLTASRTLSVSGDATGSASFDGSDNANIAVTLSNSGVSAGTYSKVTVDTKGRVTTGSSLANTDITTALGYTPFNQAGGTISGDTTFSGNVVVQGTTTQVNSTQTTLNDPIITLANNATSTDDGKDRGIEFKFGNGSSVLTGFFGYKNSTGQFTFIAPSTNSEEVETGSVGIIAANLLGNVTGNASTATKLANAQTISLTGDATASTTFDGSANATLTVSLSNSGATAGSYTSANLTIDSKGRVTSISNGTSSAAARTITTFNTVIGQATYTISSGYTVNGIDVYYKGMRLDPNFGDFTATDGSTITLAVSPLTIDEVTLVSYNIINAATATSTLNAGTLALRDANGSFAANVVTANLVGTASNATTLQTSRNISVSGDASGSASFNGSADANISVTLANSGVTSGTYGNTTAIPVFTVDSKGRVTNVTTSVISAGTPLATANTTVQRDADASFAANIVTANLVGNTAGTHTGSVIGNVTGNADTATKITTSRTLSVSGDASGSSTFDGSADANISITLANSGVNSGTYGNTTAIPVVTVDEKGRVTNVTTSVISAGTPLATVNTTVQRDTNASFSANVITASLVGNVAGNADTATKLATSRTLSVSGDASGSSTFDGSANANIAVTLTNSGVSAGVYTQVTVDSKGRVTYGSNAPQPTAARIISTFIANAGQNTFTIADGYTVGQIDVFQNGIRLEPNNNEFTANNGSTVQLNSPVTANDAVTVVGYVIANFANLSATTIANYIVQRDSAGSFSANVVTANVVGNLTGTASNATVLQTSRLISLTGDATGSVSFNGSADATITATLANSGVTAGTYSKVTVDSKGRVTTGSSLANTDITTALGYTPFNQAGGTISGDTTFSGNIVVQGTTTQVNSTQTTLTDPIITLSNDATATDDGKDRGIEFKFGNGTSVLTGFFGYKNSTGQFTFIAPSTNSGEVETGAVGTIAADLLGNVTGNAYTATKLQNSQTISLSGDATGSSSFDGSANATISVTFSNSGATSGSYGNSTAIPVITVDAKGRITNVSTSAITAGTPFATANTTVQRDDSASFAANIVTANLVGNVTGNADTATTLKTSRSIILSGDASGSANFNGSDNAAITVTLSNTGVTAGSYSLATVTVDSKGRVTSISAGSAGSGSVSSVAGRTGDITLASSDISDATAGNTGSTLVLRDPSGSFDANYITAVTLKGTSGIIGNLTGSVTGDLTGNVTGNVTGNLTGNVNGNATTATRLATARSITLYGDASGSASFDGSANASISVVLGNSGVTAGTYGNTTAIPVLTIDEKGRITSVSTSAISSGGGGGGGGTSIATPNTSVQRDENGSFAANVVTASLVGNVTGDITGNTAGTHTGSVIGNVTGNADTATKLATTRTLSVSGDASGSATFDGSTDAMITVTLTNTTVSAGTYGNASLIPVITVDAKGRLTSVTNTTVTGVTTATPNTFVQRDANASFAANVITAPSFVGTASNAIVLQTARTFALTGDATGSSTFDGSADATITATLTNTAVTAGTYGNATIIPAFTVDSKGRVTNVVATTAAITVSNTAPISPVSGQLWYNPSTQGVSVYDDASSTFVAVGGSSTPTDYGLLSGAVNNSYDYGSI